MIGIRFTRSMYPYQAGQILALENEAMALALILEGTAERYVFPDKPHANQGGQVTPITDNAPPSVAAPVSEQPRRRGRPPKGGYWMK